MPNLWSQQADICLVEWSADMTDVFRGDPSRIPKLVHRILSAGEACEVYRLHQVPEMGFQRRRHGNPADYLADWYAQGNPGFFGQMLGAEVRAKVAWFDQSGRIVDSELANMADVLTALEPYPGATDPFNTQVEPLRITGPSQSRIESIREGKGIYPAHFRIQLHSDIWLPWVWGLSHPHSDGERMFDNRPLARIHTPRLNGFLSEIASIFSELGCTLRLDDDPDGTRDWVRPWAGPDSIDIEGMIPSKVMPLEVVNAAWSE